MKANGVLLVLNLGLVLALLLSACGSTTPDFSLSLNPSTLSVQQGASGTTTLTITPQNGFTGTVNLSLVNAPYGVTLSPINVQVTGSSPVTQTLTLSVGSSVAPGTYDLQVQAVSGNLTRTTNLTLTVERATEGRLGISWTVRYSVTTPLSAVTYGNGLFVAVGGDGTILTSPDGVAWTRQNSDTTSWLSAVTYGNGLFVAVGGDGTILTSPDGVAWTRQNSDTTSWLSAVTYGNGLFVAVGVAVGGVPSSPLRTESPGPGKLLVLTESVSPTVTACSW